MRGGARFTVLMQKKQGVEGRPHLVQVEPISLPGKGDSGAFSEQAVTTVSRSGHLDLTVIIPAYNAALFIDDSLSELSSHLRRTGLRYEIIVVNDGSKDDTDRCLKTIRDRRIQVLTLPVNRGKGAAIKLGMEFARGRYIVTTDADLPYGAKAVGECYEILARGATVVIGDRTLSDSKHYIHVSLMRRLLSHIYRMLFFPLVCSCGLRDVQCGLKGFDASFGKEMLRHSSINRFAFDLELVVFAIARKRRINRMPIVLVRNAPSSLQMVLDSVYMFCDVVRIGWNVCRGYYSDKSSLRKRLYITVAELARGGYVVKRTFDILLSGIGLVCSFPMWILVGFAIRLEDGGAIFHKQERVGRWGKTFTSWKFRSMAPDSDKRFGPLQARENDHRVTRVGRFLRATALDELPQLWNIFAGDMSFVGPRALLPAEIEVNGNGEMVPLHRISGFRERHTVPPGLTGLAQVYAPRDLPRRLKFRYDLIYIRNQSFWLDLKLMALSFWITFRAKWESREKKY